MIVIHSEDLPFLCRHCLEFLYNDKILPYHLTVFQALRHFATDNDSEEELNPLGRATIWTNTHVLQYVSVFKCPMSAKLL